MDYSKIINDCVSFNLRKSSRIITKLMDGNLKEYGIRVTQMHLLAIIGLCNGGFTSKICEELGMERSTLTRNAGKLIKRGFIKSTNFNNDKRKKQLYITKDGADIFRMAYPIWDKFNKEYKEKITHDR